MALSQASREDVTAWSLATFMLGAGVAHFLITDRYAQIVPAAIGNARFWVHASGVAEIAGAALVTDRRTRRVGGWFVAVVLVAVFPANVKMALDGGLAGESGLIGNPVAAWLRLPIQIPLVMWAVRVARNAEAIKTSSASR